MLRMRSKSTLFYFFLALFAINFIVASSTGIITAQAAEGDITGANLKINHRSIDVDGTTRNLDINGVYGNFKADKLSEANFKGVNPVSAVEDNEGNIIFVARLTYEMPMNFWTTHKWSDFVRETSGVTRRVNWFRYRTYQIDAIGGQTWQDSQNVNAEWQYYRRNSFKAFYTNYRGTIEFNSLPIVLQGSNVSINSNIDSYRLDSMSPVDTARWRDIGTYDTILLQSQQDIKAELYDVNAVRDLDKDEKDASSATALSSTLKTEMEKELIRRCGIETGLVNQPVADVTKGGFGYTLAAVSVNDDVGIINNQFTLPFQISPELRIATQEIIVNRVATMEISTADARWFHSAGVTHTGTHSSTTYNDIRALEVQNYAYSQKYRFVVDVTSKMVLSGEVTAERILGDPQFEQGDLYWNMIITGDTGAMIAYTKSLGLQDIVDDAGKLSGMALEQLKMWLPYIIGIVLLVAGVYILFQVGPAIGSGQKALARKQDSQL